MCGVVGLFNASGPALPDVTRLRRMADAVSHRGPDGEGFHTEPHLGLGHRRLAIVDLAGGHQPMSVRDGTVIISFNGEIYNHEALRLELQAAGHCFLTSSDTETILHGWCEWGLGVLDRLKGMFAFALWDRRRGEFLLARDRLGEKPMHYAVLPDGTLAFGSELASLLALPEVSRGLDPAAVDDFFAFGYVPDPATIYAAIRRLPAGHFLLLRRGDPRLPVPRRYWQPPMAARAAPVGAPAELARRLDAAVQAQMMADVPLGAFLSGGVDSASIVAFASRARAEASGAALATFTIGFPGANDERPAAATIGARYGTLHRAETATSDYIAAARRVAQVFGEPFGDHSAVPTLAVCNLARRHVKVALSGDGGDEVLAGYRRYRWHVLVDSARILPASVRRRFVGALARAYPKLDNAPRWLRAKTTLTEISLDSAAGYYGTVCKLGDARRRSLFSASWRESLAGHDPAARIVSLMDACDPDDPLLAAQYVDMHTYLPGDILVKTDRASMAASLELRPPLLDHELVAWGMALPAKLKLRRSVGKHVLREAMAPHLPHDLLWARKRGFAAAIGADFRARLPDVRALLLGSAMLDSGIFDPAGIARLVDEHGSGRFDHAQAIWQLLVFEGFLASQPTAAVPASPELVGA